MRATSFLFGASTGLGVAALPLFHAFQHHGEAEASGDASSKRLIGSPTAPRLGPQLPFYAYQMSMGASTGESIHLDGDAEPVRMRAGLHATRGKVSILCEVPGAVVLRRFICAAQSRRVTLG